MANVPVDIRHRPSNAKDAGGPERSLLGQIPPVAVGGGRLGPPKQFSLAFIDITERFSLRSSCVWVVLQTRNLCLV